MGHALTWLAGTPRVRSTFTSCRRGCDDDQVIVRPLTEVLVGEMRLDPALLTAARRDNASMLKDGCALDYGQPPRGGLADVIASAHASVAEALLVRGVRGERPRTGLMGAGYVDFHIDEGFGTPSVLFVVVSLLDGGDLLLPNLGLRIPFHAGRIVMFDPLEPHGVVASGSSESGSASALFLNADIRLGMRAADHLGLIVAGGEASQPHHPPLRLDDDTGHWLAPRRAVRDLDSEAA